VSLAVRVPVEFGEFSIGDQDSQSTHLFRVWGQVFESGLARCARMTENRIQSRPFPASGIVELPQSTPGHVGERKADPRPIALVKRNTNAGYV